MREWEKNKEVYMGERQTHTEMEKALVIQWTEFALFIAYGLLHRVSEN